MIDTLLDAHNFFYTANEKRFYRDIEALHYAIQHNAEANLELNYKFLKSNMWSKNPQFDIRHYLDLHAKIIAQKYDQIIIAYSGGTDSHTVLETFIRCGIKDVEIQIIMYNEMYENTVRESIHNTLLKSLEKYTQTFKDLNYTLKGFKKDEAFIITDKNELETLFSKKRPKSYNAVDQNYSYYLAFGKHNDDKILKIRNNACIILGHEKPQLRIQNGIWNWQINNGNFLEFVVPTDNNFDLINFFITDDVPEIQIKLSWLKAEIIEQIMRENNFLKTDENAKDIQAIYSPYYVRVNTYMGYKGINYIHNSNLYKPRGFYHIMASKKSYDYRKKIGLVDVCEEYYQSSIKIEGIKRENFRISSKMIPLRKVK